MAQDAKGYIWAGTPEGLVRYNGQSWQPVEVPGTAAPVYAMTGRRDGSLWIGKPPGSQIYRLKNGTWTRFAPASGIAPGVVVALRETVDRDRDLLWVGTSQGLARCLGEECTEVAPLRGLHGAGPPFHPLRGRPARALDRHQPRASAAR